MLCGCAGSSPGVEERGRLSHSRVSRCSCSGESGKDLVSLIFVILCVLNIIRQLVLMPHLRRHSPNKPIYVLQTGVLFIDDDPEVPARLHNYV